MDQLEMKTKEDVNDAEVKDKKRRNFWIENRNLQLSAIPYSEEVLEDNDIEVYADNFLGYGYDGRRVGNEDVGEKPVLPRRCYEKDGRFFLGMMGQLQLPVEQQMATRLLCIDSQDLLFLRYEDTAGEKEGQSGETLDSLLNTMKNFYSKFTNQAKYCVGQGRWFPLLGEVVVVKIQRLLGSEVSKCGYFSDVVYQRALVREVSEFGLTVELLDDYGLGGVRYKNIFRIIDRFTTLPAQLFVCELAETGLFNTRSMVHRILMEYPITKIWPDCLMVHVETTWFGDVSEKKRPLVEILIQLNSSKFLSLKSYVYQNITACYTPLVHLTKPHTRCRVLGANNGGYLWISFLAEDQLSSRVQFVLEKLIPHYYNLLEYLHLTVDMIFPKDDEKRLKLNMKKIYAVLLPDLDKSSDLGIKSMYRVIVQKIDRKTNRVKVLCIDHFAFREINSWDLVPMYNLYPELSYFAPLVSKVHLYSIKELNISNCEVKQLLYGEELRVQLVREWPAEAFAPEVSIDGITSTELDNLNDNEGETMLLRGYNRVFVENGWAEKMDEKEMSALNNLIKAEATQLKEGTKEERIFGTLEDQRMEERKKLLAAYTFRGADYKFDWDSRHTVASSAVSVHTSSCSATSTFYREKFKSDTNNKTKSD